ncbi:uncharacterized protein Dyak_GE29103 [Drosophila yakuba]|uniref:Uncharacterized protein n=1 Tax=Drosophila yakuba TaxID=7245 RepID=A0A0R1E639_DROYA|nr:uncharacterized protein Dyak_GE29103 [Drosophila yakuba]
MLASAQPRETEDFQIIACNMYTDCCSGRNLTYGSYCGYPAKRLTKTYLSPNELTSIKKQQSKSINDEVKVIGLPSESEWENMIHSLLPKYFNSGN